MTDFIALSSWYLLVIVLGFLSFPITYQFLPFLSDRGYSLAKPMGLLIWGYSYWLFATFGIITNDYGGALFGFLIILVLDFVIVRKSGVKPILEWIKTNRGIILFSEVVFFGAFLFLLILRGADPNITGTEKPMELAFINSILQSPIFPPADPWLSGYSISYYYFGYILVAALARLSGVTGGMAFNLGVITWFAMTAQSAFGLLFTLLAQWKYRNLNILHMTSTACIKRWALLGAFFILFVSNWTGLLEIMHARGLFWKINQGEFQSNFWPWLGVKELDQPPSEPLSWEPKRNGGIWWWRASRVLQDFDMLGNDKEIIDEFPFFSYYLADLHPHVLSMPFFLLAISIAGNLHFSQSIITAKGGVLTQPIKDFLETGDIKAGSRVFGTSLRELNFWFVAWIIGSLAFINIWDFPVCIAIFSGVYVLKRVMEQGWHVRMILEFLEIVVLLGFAGILLYLPFHIGFSSQAGGVLPSLSFYTRGIYFWLMFAPLLVPILIWLIWASNIFGNKKSIGSGMGISALIVFGLWIISYLIGGLFASGSGLSSFLTIMAGNSEGISNLAIRLNELSTLFTSLHGSDNYAVLLTGSLIRRILQPGTWITLLLLIGLGIGLLLLVKGKLADMDSNNGEGYRIYPTLQLPLAHSFVLVLILLGAGLILVPEFVYLRDQFGWRMNTIFKFYYQAWILWGIAAAYSFAVLWEELRKWPGYLIKTILILTVSAGLIYPFFAIRDRIGHFQWNQFTLDGTKYMQDYNPAEYEAIKWLANAPYGIIAEAIGGSYSNYGRISTNTGKPTVLGWPGHESQWRGGNEEMGSRQNDIETLFRTTDWESARAILEKYQIRYVYLGALERSTYRANETKFTNNLNAVYQDGDVSIYEVPDYTDISRINGIISGSQSDE